MKHKQQKTSNNAKTRKNVLTKHTCTTETTERYKS